MAIVFTRSDSADLGAWRPKPTRISEDLVEASRATWTSDDGLVETGIWECSTGMFRASRIGYHEVVHVLSGRATVTEDGGEPREVGPGDTLITPAGWTGTYVVHEPMRKTFMILWQPPTLAGRIRWRLRLLRGTAHRTTRPVVADDLPVAAAAR